MSTTEDLEKLAETCLQTAKQFKEYLASNGHAQPTFDQNGPSYFPHMSQEAEKARMALRTASKTLYDLASGPDEPVCEYTYDTVHDIGAYRYVSHYKIAAALPLKEVMSYADLAAKTGTDERQLKKMIRQLIMIHVFCEPKPGHVSHTASSKLLIESGTAAMNAYEVMDTSAMAIKYIDAIDKWGHGSQEPNEAGPQILYGIDDTCYRIYEQHPEVLKRFGDCMTFVTTFPPYAIQHVVTGYDWNALGEATIVDIGGNIGQCSIEFAKANSKAKVIVQDLPNVVQRASSNDSIVPASLKDRVSFQSQSFFEQQTVEGADVYFMRMILHNYSDKYCIQILKNIIPAMKSNSRILIVDMVMPLHGTVPPVFERFIRTQDLMMQTLLNATEREYNEWVSLLAAVDSRLKIKNVTTPEGSIMSVIEVVLQE